MVDRKLAVGVLRCVFDRTMSRKSAAVGTGAMALRPFVVDIANVARIVDRKDEVSTCCKVVEPKISRR